RLRRNADPSIVPHAVFGEEPASGKQGRAHAGRLPAGTRRVRSRRGTRGRLTTRAARGHLRSVPHRALTGRVHRSASLAVIFFSVLTSGSSSALGSRITQGSNLWNHTSNAFGRPSERPTVEASPHVRSGRSRLRPHRERRAGEADPSIILTGFDALRGLA